MKGKELIDFITRNHLEDVLATPGGLSETIEFECSLSINETISYYVYFDVGKFEVRYWIRAFEHEDYQVMVITEEAGLKLRGLA